MAINQTVDQSGEQRYRHLFEHMPVCIFVADLTVMPPVILEMNQQAQQAYGYAASEIIGNPATHLVPEESRKNVQAVVTRVRQGERVEAETINRRRDGTLFPVRVIAALDPTNTGRMIVICEDITYEIQRRSEAEAIEAERLRIAHEIHDSVAQDLAALRLKAALWSHLADHAPPIMRTALHEMQAMLSAAIDDIRRAIFALRPLDLETLGFLPALSQLVTAFGDQSQLVAHLDISDPQDSLPTSYELPLFRIIQEGLNNVRKHASASLVLVSLTVDRGGSVVLSLSDNGCGFDPTQASTINQLGHFGLRQMRERIICLAGTLDIHSVIGQGTELHITLPPISKEVNDATD